MEKAGASSAAGLQGAALQHGGACHTQDPVCKHEFIVGAYRQDDVGEWSVDLPRRGPCSHQAKEACDIRLKLLRERKTGPGHPLFVVTCKTHGGYFTIYPPGFVPWARRRLPCAEVGVQEAPALEAVRDAADEKAPRWLDFADPEGNEPGWASTQWRQLRRWGLWLGLSGSEQTGQQVAAALGVALHEHAAARTLFQKPSYRQRGRALWSLLQLVGRAADRMRRLLRAGLLAGLLGRSFWVDALGRLRPLVPF